MTQFTHFSVEKTNAALLNAKMSISFDGVSASYDITGDGAFIEYTATAKTPLQVQIYQNIADSVADIPFEGVLKVFGASDAQGTGKTLLFETAVNIGTISPAKPIWSYDVNGGLGEKARKWTLGWKNKIVGLKATLTFDDGVVKDATTLGSENSLSFDLTTAAKAVGLKIELTDTATLNTFTDQFSVSFDRSISKLEMGGVIEVKTTRFNSAKMVVTKPTASTIVLTGNSIRAIDLVKETTQEKIRIGEPIVVKDMIGLFAKSQDESTAIYNMLLSGATYDDLVNAEIPDATAIRAVGIFYMKTNTEQAAAVLERQKFQAMRAKTSDQIITAMQSAGVQLPNLDLFIAQNRANLSDAQRTALFAALGIS